MKLSQKEAIHDAMQDKMRSDPKVLLIGEDVGGRPAFGVSVGLMDEFGRDRILETGISENAIVGCAIGASLTGYRPIAEIMMMDWITVCMDQIANQAAKFRYMFGGKTALPLVIRSASGGPLSAGAQHSQNWEAWLTHIPGIKVVFPSCPQDAYSLLVASIEDDNPVVFVEHKVLYRREGEVDKTIRIPLGKGEIKREGKDITIVATGMMVNKALSAAEKLEQDGISVEVVDPRTLYPLDKNLIANSVAKTHNAIVTTEETKRGSYAGEISAFISEELFDELDSPVKRVCAFDTPAPYTKALEQFYFPSDNDLVNAVKKQLA